MVLTTTIQLQYKSLLFVIHNLSNTTYATVSISNPPYCAVRHEKNIHNRPHFSINATYQKYADMKITTQNVKIWYRQQSL